MFCISKITTNNKLLKSFLIDTYSSNLNIFNMSDPKSFVLLCDGYLSRHNLFCNNKIIGFMYM